MEFIYSFIYLLTQSTNNWASFDDAVR